MLNSQITALLFLGLIAPAQAAEKLSKPTENIPVIPRRRNEVVCTQKDVSFSIRRSSDGTLFAIDLVNERDRIARSFDGIKMKYPSFREEWQREKAALNAYQEVVKPSPLGECALMQACEIQEPGSPVLAECRHEDGSRKRKLTVALRVPQPAAEVKPEAPPEFEMPGQPLQQPPVTQPPPIAYELKCEEWNSKESDPIAPSLSDYSYNAFTKQIKFQPETCR